MLLYSSFLNSGGAGSGGAVTDPYFANVVLLCGFDGADGATSTTDDSSSHKTITFVGNAQLDTAQKKFGASSLLLDGTGDYLTFADSNDWQLGATNSSPWTVEAWVRWNVLDANNRGIIGQGPSPNFGWAFGGSATIGEISVALSTAGSSLDVSLVSSGAGMTTGVWYHVCVDKDATGKIRLYVNGVMYGSSTPANTAIFNSGSGLAVGANGTTGAADMNGWLDEIRVTKGVARYASDSGFIVPSAAFPRS